MALIVHAQARMAEPEVTRSAFNFTTKTRRHGDNERMGISVPLVDERSFTAGRLTVLGWSGEHGGDEHESGGFREDAKGRGLH